MQTTLSITINAPAETIFTYLTDADKLTQWQTFLASAEQTSAGDIQEGTTFRLTIDVQEQFPQAVSILKTPTMALDGTVVSYDPYERLVIQGTSEPATVGIAYDCNETNGTTRLTQETTLDFNNLLINAVAPLIKGVLEKRAKADLQRLKQLVESSI